MLARINDLLSSDLEIISFLKHSFSRSQERNDTFQLYKLKHTSAMEKLNNIDVVSYSKTRNYEKGATSHLSPYISTGLLSTVTIYQYIKDHFSFESAEKFIQEIVWREFWNQVIENNNDLLWRNAEDYKTGFDDGHYQDKIPEDILTASTPSKCINQFIKKLYKTGFIHNHIRMYLASYVIHFRGIKWQTGAKWFAKSLIDEHPPSNCLSWQWVASTFSQKPYIFNLDNVRKFVSKEYDTTPENNKELDDSYNILSARLFPNMKKQ